MLMDISSTCCTDKPDAAAVQGFQKLLASPSFALSPAPSRSTKLLTAASETCSTAVPTPSATAWLDEDLPWFSQSLLSPASRLGGGIPDSSTSQARDVGEDFWGLALRACEDKPVLPESLTDMLVSLGSQQSSLRTPVPASYTSCSSPPPVPGRSTCKPPLLKALLHDSVQEVRTACLGDADAALMPFFDHDVEPPLCAAARLRCGPDVFMELLEHGANVEMTDVHGRGPLAILNQDIAGQPQQEAVVAILRAAGADDAADVAQESPARELMPWDAPMETWASMTLPSSDEALNELLQMHDMWVPAQASMQEELSESASHDQMMPFLMFLQSHN